MHWLAIDTSMNGCGVGVARADGAEFIKTEHMMRGQSERLMPMLTDIVAQAGLSLPDIDAFVVTCGPGTFTGLRIGLSVARALAQVSGKPLVGIETFDGLYESAREQVAGKPACVLVETKRSDYYMRIFDANGMAEGAGTCVSAEDLRALLTPDHVLIGDANARAMAETGFSGATIDIVSPDPSAMIACAKRADLTQNRSVTPVYLRSADVSVSRQKIARIVQ